MMSRKAAAAVCICAAAVGAAILLIDQRDEPGQPRIRATKVLPARDVAVIAATRFLLGLDAATLLDRRARTRHIARWTSPDERTSLLRRYEAEAARLSPLIGRFSRAGLLGYRVARLSPHFARVEIWAVSIATSRSGQPTVGQRTVAVSLKLNHGSWKVTEAEAVPGPSLEPKSQRARALTFEEYEHVP
jgi:hypothetical protein